MFDLLGPRFGPMIILVCFFRSILGLHSHSVRGQYFEFFSANQYQIRPDNDKSISTKIQKVQI